MVFNEDDVRIVRGRTHNSQNLLHRGYRYSKDGKLTVDKPDGRQADGRQAWRCVRKKDKCRGRLYTLNEQLRHVTKPHNHDMDIADSEVRIALSTAKDLAASTRTTNQQIYCSVSGSLSQPSLLQLPSIQAVKKQAQRARPSINYVRQTGGGGFG